MDHDEVASFIRKNQERMERQSAECERMKREFDKACAQAAVDAQMIVLRAQVQANAMLARRLTQKRITVAM